MCPYVYNVSLIIECVFIVHYVYWVYVCVFCTLSSVQSVNMYCPYVNCCWFFCTVWSTVNAPVQFFFCTVCAYVNCLLFFLQCLSICTFFFFFFFSHCLQHAHHKFSLTKALCCGDVTIKVIWFDLIWRLITVDWLGYCKVELLREQTSEYMHKGAT